LAVSFVSGVRVRLVCLVFVLFLLSPLVGVGEVQWGSERKIAIVHRGEGLVFDEYRVMAVDFPPPVEYQRSPPGVSVEYVTNPFVALEVYKNEVLMEQVVLRENGVYVTRDEGLKIKVLGFSGSGSSDWVYESYHPWAKVVLIKRGEPDLKVKFRVGQDVYNPTLESNMDIQVEIENRGMADLENVNVTVELGGLPLRSGRLEKTIYRLSPGEKFSLNLTAIIPRVVERKSYTLTARAEGVSDQGEVYVASAVKSIAVLPALSVSLQKIVTDRIYLKDLLLVSLSVDNTGLLDIKRLQVRDSVPRGFELASNTSLQWDIDISNTREWRTEYLLRPLEPHPGGYRMPAATASFTLDGKTRTITSNRPVLKIHGPKLEVSKTTDKSHTNPGGKVAVKITLKNTGDTLTRVNTTDHIPPNVTLISGSLNYSGFLDPGETQEFTYTIRLESGATLPPLKVYYTPLGRTGDLRFTTSGGVKITVTKPVKITPAPPTPTPLPSPTPTPAKQEIPKTAAAETQTNSTESETTTATTPTVLILFSILVVTFLIILTIIKIIL